MSDQQELEKINIFAALDSDLKRKSDRGMVDSLYVRKMVSSKFSQMKENQERLVLAIEWADRRLARLENKASLLQGKIDLHTINRNAAEIMRNYKALVAARAEMGIDL